MSSESVQDRFWSKVDVQSPDECWEWAASTGSHGYGAFNLDGSEVIPAHWVSWMLETGEWADDHVLHYCDNKRCVNPSHLYEGTHQDNMVDAFESGLSQPPEPEIGEQNPNSKLSVSEVSEIRSRYPDDPYSALASEFSVSKQCIAQIIKRKTWKHID